CALVAVLAATDVEEVVGAGVDRVARPRSLVGEADPTPLAAALEEEDVAAIGVDVHLLGVEGEDAQLHQAISRTVMIEPTWEWVGGTSWRPAGFRPASTASASIVSIESRLRGASSSSALRVPVGETVWRRRRTTIVPASTPASSGRLE